MLNWITHNKLLIGGILIGAAAGFFYWQQIGCTSGSCPITSKWHNSMVYGAIMGGLLFSIFEKKQKEKENE
jgi:hypothetical protein